MYFHGCNIKTSHHEKNEFTIILEACNHVEGFKTAYEKLSQQVAISNRSESTLKNYSTRIAVVSLHFGCMPQQIQDYLGKLAGSAASLSRSSFKHTMCGLRFYFKVIGLPKRSIDLPSIHAKETLLTVLSKVECKLLFKTPFLLKHRLALCFIYSTGLRVSGFSNIKIGDIDFDRIMVQVRVGKGQKDRHVPLSKLIMPGMKKYLYSEHPWIYLFEGNRPGNPYSTCGVRWVMRQAVTKEGIIKENVCVHTLRHSYATLHATKCIMKGLPVTEREKKPKKNWKQVCEEKLNFDPERCPCFKMGGMVTKEYLEKTQRGPPVISSWDNIQVTHEKNTC